MPRHDADVRLRHMLDAAREGVQMAQGKARAALDADRPPGVKVSLMWGVGLPEDVANDNKLCSRMISRMSERWRLIMPIKRIALINKGFATMAVQRILLT